MPLSCKSTTSLPLMHSRLPPPAFRRSPRLLPRLHFSLLNLLTYCSHCLEYRHDIYSPAPRPLFHLVVLLHRIASAIPRVVSTTDRTTDHLLHYIHFLVLLSRTMEAKGAILKAFHEVTAKYFFDSSFVVFPVAVSILLSCMLRAFLG